MVKVWPVDSENLVGKYKSGTTYPSNVFSGGRYEVCRNEAAGLSLRALGK
jgi:hypothetical protein